jgi:hypothetical protein
MCCVRINKNGLFNGKQNGMAYIRTNSTFFVTIRVHYSKFETNGTDLLSPNSEVEEDIANKSEAYICETIAICLHHASLVDCASFSVLKISDDCAAQYEFPYFWTESIFWGLKNQL